jgi:YesN/AraC family two-component response regulator
MNHSVNSTHYFINDTLTCAPADSDFRFKFHDYYEILLFLEGDAKFIIENRTYTLEPYDVIIVRKHEMHRLSLNRSVHYHRITLFVYPSFFQEYCCSEYEEQFLITDANIDNKIAGKVVRSSGLYDAFMKYCKYLDTYNLDEDSPILRAIIIDILFLINNTTKFVAPDYSNNSMKTVIAYLNEHYTEDINLDILEKEFFLTKSYLCKAFRKATGLTIFNYIQKKRLTNVQELLETGMDITSAARISGFRDYSSFYRAHKKEFGETPRQSLKS